jgi:alpha-amylase
VFYDHYWQQHGQLGSSIQQLLKVRKACGIHSRSKVVIRRATADCYAALIDDKLAMKMGHGDYSPNHDVISNGSFRWELVVSGPKFAVWAQPGLVTEKQV